MGQRILALATAICDTGGRPRKSPARFSLFRFYGEDVPALLRHNLWLMLLVGMFFLASIGVGYSLAVLFPSLAEHLLGSFARQLQQMGGIAAVNTSVIALNNLRILLITPVLSLLTLGLYPLLVVALPGVLLGMAAGYAPIPPSAFLLLGLLLLLPHAIFELPAILFGTVLSMRLGWALVHRPPGLTVGEGLLWAFLNLVKGYVGVVVPLLLLAAWVEANITGGVLRLLLRAMGQL
jgi:uncharacterized membrane protein SpoIIM required for sporulation